MIQKREKVSAFYILMSRFSIVLFWTRRWHKVNNSV